jgi:demethylmenaquinone methyltransferase/2-methoxy-6-polyprenyl-1,4-benzoquinol methylase
MAPPGAFPPSSSLSSLSSSEPEVPAVVRAAYDRAEAAGFRVSCEPGVGWLLAALGAAVPAGGRVLELGTGVGVGLAWITSGLGGRAGTDVEVVSVELDAARAAAVEAAGWPAGITIVVGDGAELAGRLGSFDLVFADAPGGKTARLDATIGALRPGGTLLVDDMDAARHTDPDLIGGLRSIRHGIFDHPDLVAAELPFASGVILATRRLVPIPTPA